MIINKTVKGGGGSDKLASVVDGTVTEITAEDLGNISTILDYAFYNRKTLAKVEIPSSVTSVKQYAFRDCTALGDLTLPSSLTSIGNYAFNSVGSGKSTTFVLNPTNPCSVGNYAFSSSRIAKVLGKYSSIGSYAFQTASYLTEVDMECSSLADHAFYNSSAITKVKVKMNGSVGTYAFYGLTKASDIDFSEMRITSIGEYAFARFASDRASASSNIITIDLRSSSFTTIPQHAFGDSNSTSTYISKYMRIFFPDSVTSIAGYAFRFSDHCDYFFDSSIPPTLSATTAWHYATNYHIFAKYGVVNEYRTATNWTAQASNIYGYAPADTFSLGDTLPGISPEGYELHWYSDTALTIPAETVTDPSARYYCTVGTEKIAYALKSLTMIDCSVTVTDSDGTEYQEGDAILIGRELTITATPSVEGYTPFIFMVNGADFESGGTYTITDSDISIIAVYYNGQDIPIIPTFADNSWTVINIAFRTGRASNFWHAGDTKPVTLKDGRTYTIRIADMQTGRYDLADGSGSSNGVLEFVEGVNVGSVNTFKMNTTSTNNGGWAECDMRKTDMPSIEALLPDDMLAAISEVNVLSGTGRSTVSGTSSSVNKLFLPAEMEMFSSKHYSIGIEECPLGQFDYYKEHNTNADRVKKKLGATSGSSYWCRSPYSNTYYYFCYVKFDGSAAQADATTAISVAPIFAI